MVHCGNSSRPCQTVIIRSSGYSHYEGHGGEAVALYRGIFNKPGAREILHHPHLSLTLTSATDISAVRVHFPWTLPSSCELHTPAPSTLYLLACDITNSGGIKGGRGNFKEGHFEVHNIKMGLELSQSAVGERPSSQHAAGLIKYEKSARRDNIALCAAIVPTRMMLH